MVHFPSLSLQCNRRDSLKEKQTCRDAPFRFLSRGNKAKTENPRALNIGVESIKFRLVIQQMLFQEL